MKKDRKRLFLLLVSLITVSAIFILPLIGRTSYPISLWFRLGENIPESLIFKERFWNTLLAFAAGGGLSLAGLILQTLFRNSLASPFTLGIAGGASFGAVFTIYFLPASLFLSEWSGGCGICLGSFLGAGLAGLIILFLGRNRDLSSETILLAGIGINFLFSGLILFLQYLSEEGSAFRMVRWTMGEISLVNIWFLFLIIGVVIGAALFLLFFSRELDILQTGEERAISLGINLRSLRLFLFLVSSLLVGVIVSVCGPIGFVGLMSPHIARIFTGPNHRILVPASLLFGALFLALCSTISRILFYPDILPVGVITSLLGGSFFLWLLFHKESGG